MGGTRMPSDDIKSAGCISQASLLFEPGVVVSMFIWNPA